MDMEMITDLMEAVMILCFGLSWPISIRKNATKVRKCR